MNAFEAYLLKEYQLSQNAVCNKFTYSHSTKQKIDKDSKRPVINNIINVKIESYDDKHNLLGSHTEKFIDGQIQRTKQNKLINISPAELNNKFGFAKSQIVQVIVADYNNKLKDIQEKINEINEYVHTSHVIPNEFINEPIVGDETNEKPKNKHFEF